MSVINELFGDRPTMSLLLKTLSYTVFYAGVAYLPLRILASIVGRVQTHTALRKTERRDEQIRKLISP